MKTKMTKFEAENMQNAFENFKEIEERLEQLENYTQARKTKTVWHGKLYETNDTIILNEALQANCVYVFTLYRNICIILNTTYIYIQK